MEPRLYLPIGPPASGKSWLLQKALEAGLVDQDAVVCPDTYRRILTGSEADQTLNSEVFEIVRKVCWYRLRNGLSVWVDATNLKPEWRQGPVDYANLFSIPITSILMTANKKTCLDRNAAREHPVPDDVMERMLDIVPDQISSFPGKLVTDTHFLDEMLVGKLAVDA